MLSCKDISNLASSYIDRNLSPFMQMKVKMHLLMCDKCRNFVNQLNATVNTLKKLKPPIPDDNFIEKQADKLMDIARSLKPDRRDDKNE